MGMTISLVIVSFIIMMVNGDNLSRTGTAVFIPLTILALELTIAGKIPVVGYYTLMDIFFLTCFITSMMVSIESGIVYILTTSRSKLLYNIFAGVLHFEDIVKKYEKKNRLGVKRKTDHDSEYMRIKEKQMGGIIMDDIESNGNGGNGNGGNGNGGNGNGGNGNGNGGNGNGGNGNGGNGNGGNGNGGIIMDDIESNGNKEFDGLISILEKTASYSEATSPKIKTVIKEIDDSQNDTPLETVYNEIVGKEVLKTVDYDDSNLSLSFKEYLVFWEIRNKMIIADNICRVLLPVIFFSIIIVIFSYK